MLTAIIQARMNSSRLPGKVLKKVNNKSMLTYLIERIKNVPEINKIIISTSTNYKDDEIQQYCEKNKILFYRGSENNLAERFFKTAKKFNSSNIIRLTGDCPLMDPKILSEQIKAFFQKNYDYCYLGLSFPEGICSDLFSIKVLDTIYKNAKSDFDLEHITPFIKKNSNIFKIGEIKDKKDNSKYRFTLDYAEDFLLIEQILKKLYKPDMPPFSSEEIIDFLNANNDVYNLNSHITRNEWSIGNEKLAK